jgi:acetyl esterase/lipase
MTGETILWGACVLGVATLATAVLVASALTAETQALGPAQPADTSRVQPSRPPDKEVVYKKTPQAELKLFVYVPGDWKKDDRRPAIIFFFGGGFTGGTPEQFYSKAEYFASRGMVAFCAQYRVFGVHKTTMDKCVEDARSAMRFVRKHAAEWGVDPNRLVSSGGSAGAHMAACVALLDGFDDKDDDPAVSCRPQAMVLFNPVLDMSNPQRRADLPPGFLQRVPGDTVEEKEKALRALSPIDHVKAGCPPGIIFYGTRDKFLDPGRDFVRKSLALGNKVELWTAEDMPHGFFNATPWHEATLRKADEFLTSLGYLTGAPAVKPADDKAKLVKETP